MEIDIDHPANAGILTYLRSRLSTVGAASQSPESIDDPYYNLGTHPDLVTRLWDQVTVDLPERCNWVVYRRPALVHPRTGIIFAFATGTHVYAFRLPERDRLAAIRAGATKLHTFMDGTSLDVSTIGDEWVFGSWLAGEAAWCAAAYAYAGSPDAGAG